ncbi:uncharacterized protein LOC124261070 [Haliotis rubra]|uniref:uncharacterized protein LOC124261070 n=1 Tax=Haliotis rubra TaxID=36100 RepID=UPI001EE4FCED|nr:uncharacterized protein LOC124261070 [Haliotis rubra]
MGNLIPSSAKKEAEDKLSAIQGGGSWEIFKIENGKMKPSSKGKDFKKLLTQFSDKEVAFGYYRHEAGVFMIIVWAGQKSSPTDKLTLVTATPFLLAMIKTFADQLMTGKLAGVDLDSITKLVNKAKGLTKGTPLQ